MKKLILALMFLASICNAQVAHDKAFMADSGKAVYLAIDSASMAGQKTFIDTTYIPNETGVYAGWWYNYIFVYGIGDIDSAYILKMAADSGHIGIALQTTYDGFHWSTVRSDTTMRTRFTPDRDSIPRYQWIDASTFITDDSARCCPQVRAAVYLYRDIDSLDTGYDIADTVLLHRIFLHGLNML